MIVGRRPGGERPLAARRRSIAPSFIRSWFVKKNQLRKVGTALGSQQEAVQACKFRDSQLFRARVGGETGGA